MRGGTGGVARELGKALMSSSSVDVKDFSTIIKFLKNTPIADLTKASEIIHDLQSATESEQDEVLFLTREVLVRDQSFVMS